MEGGRETAAVIMTEKKEWTMSPLEARVAFVGMIDGTEKWARAAWKKNPQLRDFYQAKRLAQVDNDLYAYDKWADTRDDYANGRRIAYFYNKETGLKEEREIYADAKEELKEILLAGARSFEPDPDDYGEDMCDFFRDCGMDWMSRGLPTRWQEFDECCLNPDYDGSLSWDEDDE